MDISLLYNAEGTLPRLKVGSGLLLFKPSTNRSYLFLLSCLMMRSGTLLPAALTRWYGTPAISLCFFCSALNFPFRNSSAVLTAFCSEIRGKYWVGRQAHQSINAPGMEAP